MSSRIDSIRVTLSDENAGWLGVPSAVTLDLLADGSVRWRNLERAGWKPADPEPVVVVNAAEEWRAREVNATEERRAREYAEEEQRHRALLQQIHDDQPGPRRPFKIGDFVDYYAVSNADPRRGVITGAHPNAADRVAVRFGIGASSMYVARRRLKLVP